MQIAIYSRKSKLSEQGDSVENQINLCRQYIKLNCKDDENILIYEDDGFSGKDTERPMFKKLMNDIKQKKIKMLVCYKIDRISRNVADFSNTIKFLEQYNVDFVSITEKFDTSTPMGRAMIHISSVFAQLERETIAQRICDNLLEMAKSGRYLGAKAPAGYKKKKKYYISKTGNKKTYNVLELDKTFATQVKDIFERYKSWQSINKLMRYYIQNGIKSNTGKDYTCVAIRRILTNPVYCQANEKAYDYFKNLGCIITNKREDFTGEFGISAFRRSRTNKWIISIGEHKPIISAKDFIFVQDIIYKRSENKIRKANGTVALLSGILRCKNCGAYMRPYSKSGNRFYYVCEMKENSRKCKCDTKNIRGDLLDQQILDYVIKITDNKTNEFRSFNKKKNRITKKQIDISEKIKVLENQINENEKSISNLIKKIASSDNETIEKYIEQKIEELDRQIKSFQAQIESFKNQNDNFTKEKLDIEIVSASIINLKNKTIDTITKRNLLKNIIKELAWDGSSFFISLFNHL